MSSYFGSKYLHLTIFVWFYPCSYVCSCLKMPKKSQIYKFRVTHSFYVVWRVHPMRFGATKPLLEANFFGATFASQAFLELWILIFLWFFHEQNSMLRESRLLATPNSGNLFLNVQVVTLTFENTNLLYFKHKIIQLNSSPCPLYIT